MDHPNFLRSDVSDIAVRSSVAASLGFFLFEGIRKWITDDAFFVNGDEDSSVGGDGRRFCNSGDSVVVRSGSEGTVTVDSTPLTSPSCFLSESLTLSEYLRV